MYIIDKKWDVGNKNCSKNKYLSFMYMGILCIKIRPILSNYIVGDILIFASSLRRLARQDTAKVLEF